MVIMDGCKTERKLKFGNKTIIYMLIRSNTITSAMVASSVNSWCDFEYFYRYSSLPEKKVTENKPKLYTVMISCLNGIVRYDMMKYHSSPNMSLTHLVPYIESPKCGI